MQREFRRLLDPFLTPDRIAANESKVRSIAVSLLDGIARRAHVEMVSRFTERFEFAQRFRSLISEPGRRPTERSRRRLDLWSGQRGVDQGVTRTDGASDGSTEDFVAPRAILRLIFWRRSHTVASKAGRSASKIRCRSRDSYCSAVLRR